MRRLILEIGLLLAAAAGSGCSGVSDSRPAPVPAADLAPTAEPEAPPRFVELAAAGKYSCARRSDGFVACWGRNDHYQLGRVTQERERVPPIALGDLSAVQITAGVGHACALGDDGRVSCWGDNGEGQIGDGAYDARGAPTQVPGLTDVVQVAAGAFHTCARREDGAVLCWGLNRNGQLGDGSRDNRRSPAVVPGLVATEIAAGGRYSCARVEGGRVRCWGSNDGGLGGAGAPSASPVAIPGLSEITSLSVGGQHACALSADGTVACWGRNGAGQLGDPETTASSSEAPVAVAGLTDVIAIAAGARHSCALRRAGTIACWGDGGRGRLGDGEAHPGSRRQPARDVVGVSDAVAVAVGDSHACAVRAGAAVVCWGANSHGQLGAGSTEPRLRPTPVEGLADAERVGEELGLAYVPPPVVRVPEMMEAAIAEGYCEARSEDDPESVYEACFRRLATRDEPRAGFLYGRLHAERCRWRASCVAPALRHALLFQDDPATRALLREAAQLDSICVAGGEVPEGALRVEVEGAGDLVFYEVDEESHFMTDGARTCAVGAEPPRRVQVDGSRVLLELMDRAAGHDEGCLTLDDSHSVVVIDLAVGELLTLPTGRFFEDQCRDDRPSRRRAPRPIQVRIGGETLTVGRSLGRDVADAPTHWLIGRTLTWRDGAYTLASDR